MEHAYIHLLHLLAGHPAWTLTVICLAAFLEAIAVIGTFVPGSTAMFLAGALVGTGSLSLGWALLSAIAGAIAGVISSVASIALWFGDRDRNPIAAIAIALLAPIAAMVIQMSISRTREYDADEDGARLTGDPLALASALRKLELGVQRAPLEPTPQLQNASHMMIANPFSARDMSKLFSTHPPMADRIARLEGMVGGYHQR